MINLNPTDNREFLTRPQLGVKVNNLGNAYVCFLKPGEKGLTSKELDTEIAKFR